MLSYCCQPTHRCNAHGKCSYVFLLKLKIEITGTWNEFDTQDCEGLLKTDYAKNYKKTLESYTLSKFSHPFPV